MSSSNSYFLICIQISQGEGQVVWYSCLLKNFLQFVVIHTIKGFCIVNKTEIYVFFWNSLVFWWPTICWQFDLWFLCLFENQLEHLLDVKIWLIEKYPDAGKYRRQEEKVMTENEMVGWHYQLNGHEFEQILGDSKGQKILSCCSSSGCKESGTTWWLNNNKNNNIYNSDIYKYTHTKF